MIMNILMFRGKMLCFSFTLQFLGLKCSDKIQQIKMEMLSISLECCERFVYQFEIKQHFQLELKKQTNKNSNKAEKK